MIVSWKGATRIPQNLSLLCIVGFFAKSFSLRYFCSIFPTKFSTNIYQTQTIHDSFMHLVGFGVEVFSHQVWWFKYYPHNCMERIRFKNLEFSLGPPTSWASVAYRCLDGVFNGAPINGRKELGLPGVVFSGVMGPYWNLVGAHLVT